MWHAWERVEKCKGFWWENLKERDHLKDRGVDCRMELELILGGLAGVGCGVDSPGSGSEPVAGSGESGDELPGTGATELVRDLSTCGSSQKFFHEIEMKRKL
jgi:hypothetical protein